MTTTCVIVGVAVVDDHAICGLGVASLDIGPWAARRRAAVGALRARRRSVGAPTVFTPLRSPAAVFTPPSSSDFTAIFLFAPKFIHSTFPR